MTADGQAKEIKPGAFKTQYSPERRPRLNVRFVEITVDNLDIFYPLFQQEKAYPRTVERLRMGATYALVALDPDSGQKAGDVWVNHEQDNLLSIGVAPEYQKRGVATQLLRRLQADPRFETLTLDNLAGTIGDEFYAKMGFVPQSPNTPWRMVWKRPQSTSVL